MIKKHKIVKWNFELSMKSFFFKRMQISRNAPALLFKYDNF